MADISVNILGATGIVGAGMPLATGCGLSAKYRGTDQVAVVFFGDGASNQGTFHESLNLASVWDLPVVYVCENNHYAMSFPVAPTIGNIPYRNNRLQYSSTHVKNIADRAVAYNIPGVTVDGMDVIAVYEVAKEAVERARKGKGPTLVECKTYRYLGMETGDDWTLYRTKEEVEQWKKKDPIPRLRKMLISKKMSSLKEIEAVEQNVKKELEEALKFAEESPDPDPEETLKDQFVSPYY